MSGYRIMGKQRCLAALCTVASSVMLAVVYFHSDSQHYNATRHDDDIGIGSSASLRGAERKLWSREASDTASSAAAAEGYRMAVVTASFGGRDHIDSLPIPPENGVKCILYTDRPVPNPNGWIVVTTPYHEMIHERWPWIPHEGRHALGNITHPVVHSVMAAKFYKMNMYLLPEVAGIDIIMWADAAHFRLIVEATSSGSWRDILGRYNTDLVEYAEKTLDGHHDMAIEAHRRSTLMSDFRLLKKRAVEVTNYTDAPQEMQEALDHQFADGFRDFPGLYCHGARFIINASSPSLQGMLQAWWREVQLYTFRDQVSFPYIALQQVQRHNFSCRLLRWRSLRNVIYHGHEDQW